MLHQKIFQEDEGMIFKLKKSLPSKIIYICLNRLSELYGTIIVDEDGEFYVFRGE